MDPIDRQAAIDAIIGWFKSLSLGRTNAKSYLIGTILDLPSAQPERKNGKWVRTYRNGFGTLVGRCDQCGRTYPVDNFCANCGAKMEGAEEE